MDLETSLQVPYGIEGVLCDIENSYCEDNRFHSQFLQTYVYVNITPCVWQIA